MEEMWLAVLPQTALPDGLGAVRVRPVDGLPLRRLALVHARDAYLTIADRAVRDALLRLVAPGPPRRASARPSARRS